MKFYVYEDGDYDNGVVVDGRSEYEAARALELPPGTVVQVIGIKYPDAFVIAKMGGAIKVAKS